MSSPLLLRIHLCLEVEKLCTSQRMKNLIGLCISGLYNNAALACLSVVRFYVKKLSSSTNSYMHKRQLLNHSQRVLGGYGIFVIDMVFVGYICKVKSSQLTQKLLNSSSNSYRTSWNARGSPWSKSTIAMKRGYTIECFLQKPSLPKLKKKTSGMKKQKERGTLMASSDATGSHKLPLLFIGKAANPRCFKHVNKAALLIVYRSQKNAWADAAIFTDWFNCHFIPSVKSTWFKEA